MNSDLRRLVHDRLSAEDLLTKNWSSLVLAACDGRDALDGALQNAKTTAKADEKATARGKTKTTLQALGWTAALESYRPFLSYNELGSMLDEGPSKLYDPEVRGDLVDTPSRRR